LTGAAARAAPALALAGALAAPAAQAAMLAPCADPVLFPGADVNLVVIPYALGGPDEDYRLRPDLYALLESDTAGKLANLIQLDTLASLRYPAGMAVVHLIPSGEPCGPEDVLPDLTAQMEEGKGLVLLWGSFLEEEGQIYVQSYLQLFRKGRDDLAEVKVDLLGGQVSLAGGPSQHALGFAPRILTGDDLGRIGEAGDEARKIWSEPAGGSVVGELPATAEAPYAYYVTEVDPGTGRMRIRPHEYFGGGDGWVEARSDWPLRDRIPELHFVDGAMGYLATRIIAEERPEGAWRGQITPGDAAAEDWMRRLAVARERSRGAFARFREDSSATVEADDLDLRVSAALSHLYSGMLDLVMFEAGGPTGEKAALAAAVEAFGDASGLLPYRSDARNLEAVARAGLAGDDPEQLALAVQALREALSVDPANKIAARNLAALYRLLLDTGSAELAGLPADDVRARLAALER
jgi:hypothetical protein